MDATNETRATTCKRGGAHPPDIQIRQKMHDHANAKIQPLRIDSKTVLIPQPTPRNCHDVHPVKLPIARAHVEPKSNTSTANPEQIPLQLKKAEIATPPETQCVF